MNVPSESLSRAALGAVSTLDLELLVMGLPHRQSLIMFPYFQAQDPQRAQATVTQAHSSTQQQASGDLGSGQLSTL